MLSLAYSRDPAPPCGLTCMRLMYPICIELLMNRTFAVPMGNNNNNSVPDDNAADDVSSLTLSTSFSLRSLTPADRRIQSYFGHGDWFAREADC
jgi:hypothetical protein